MNKKEISASLAGTVSLRGEVSVNRLGFGAMRLTGEGIWGPPRDRKKALAVLRRAVELDVKFIDTADSYGPNVSEELIAEALFPYSEGLVIATKGGWDRPGPDQWTHDATPAHLRKAVEGSLKRLRLDRIDLYQLHTPDPVVSFDASVETLAQLRAEGKIRLVGLSNVTGSISSVRAGLFPSCLFRTDTVLPIANGTTSSIIVRTTKLHSFHGILLQRARSLATCSVRSPKRVRQARSRLH
jgi:pyridoxine 4-dehydrogenase